MDEPAPQHGTETPVTAAVDPVPAGAETAAEPGTDAADETGTATGADTGTATGADTEEPTTETTQAQAPAATPRRLPAKIVFRIPGSVYVPILFAIVCASFVGAAAPWLALVFLFPLAAIVYVMRTRTEVDAQRLVVRTVLRRRVLPWSEVTSLRVADKGWVRAVRTDGAEIALPSVRTRHLPAVALISRGRISDPTTDA